MNQDVDIVQRYRDSHHRLAEMFAMGCTPAMVRRQTGLSMRRLSTYLADPTFQELIAAKSARAAEKLELAGDAYIDSAIANMLAAEQQITDHLDDAREAGELLPINILDKISQGRADRFGYAKNSKLEVTHDFATALDKAIARSGKAKLIEGELGAAGATPALGSNALDVEAPAHPQAIEVTATHAPIPEHSALPLPATSGGGRPVTCGETQRPVPSSQPEAEPRFVLTRTYTNFPGEAIKRRRIA